MLSLMLSMLLLLLLLLFLFMLHYKVTCGISCPPHCRPRRDLCRKEKSAPLSTALASPSALTSLALNLSPNPFAAADIVFWMMGSLADRSFTHVWLAAPFMAVGALLLASLGRGLDALTLGEDAAQALGIGLSGLRLRLILGTAACVGAATAVAGAIGFVGLVVPHLLRPAVGARPSALLWASALGGAAMVLAADIAVRELLPARDLKLGVLMALVGAPLFLHLIYKTRKEMA